MSTDKVYTFNFRTFSNLFLGLFVGVVIGIFAYLLGDRMLNGSDSHLKGIVSQEGIERTNTSISEDDQKGINEFLADEILNLELQRISESFRTLKTQELLDLFEIISVLPWTSRVYTIQQILVEYIVQNSPEEALTAITKLSDNRSHALLRVVFASWSQVNLDKALTAATELSRADRQIAIDTVMATRSDLSSENWSMLASRFNFLPEVEDWEQKLSVYEILDLEPLSAIELLANDDIDDGLQINLYRLITDELFQHVGMNTILQLEAARLDAGVNDALFEQVTAHDREAVLAFLSTVEESRRQTLGWRLLKSWIANDEEEAFQAIVNLPKSNFRQSMLRSLAIDWARKDPDAILDRLMEIPRSVRDDALSIATGELANIGPKDLLDRIATLRAVPGVNVGRAMESVMRTWSTDAPKQALDWVQSNTKEETPLRKELLSQVLPKFALVEPEQAMTIAVEEHTPDDIHLSLQYHVLSSLLLADEFDMAIELLDQVHSDVKLSQHREVGKRLLMHDRLDDTLKLADSLTDEEKFEYFKGVASSGVIFGRTTDVLKMIARLPTTDLQTGVAEQLLNVEYYLRQFTNEQLETLKAFVSRSE